MDYSSAIVRPSDPQVPSEQTGEARDAGTTGANDADAKSEAARATEDAVPVTATATATATTTAAAATRTSTAAGKKGKRAFGAAAGGNWF